jgi:hypothetical protein
MTLQLWHHVDKTICSINAGGRCTCKLNGIPLPLPSNRRAGQRISCCRGWDRSHSTLRRRRPKKQTCTCSISSITTSSCQRALCSCMPTGAKGAMSLHLSVSNPLGSWQQHSSSCVCIHLRRKSWHMHDKVQLLQRLRWGEVGFANLRHKGYEVWHRLSAPGST